MHLFGDNGEKFAKYEITSCLIYSCFYKAFSSYHSLVLGSCFLLFLRGRQKLPEEGNKISALGHRVNYGYDDDGDDDDDDDEEDDDDDDDDADEMMWRREDGGEQQSQRAPYHPESRAMTRDLHC